MQNYEYGTNPRKADPYRKPVVGTPLTKKPKSTKKQIEEQKQKEIEKRKKEAAKKRLEMNKKASTIFYLVIGFAFIFTIGYRSSIINEKFTNVSKQKAELSVIQKENEQIKAEIETNLNLSNVEKIATENLGMKKLSKEQIINITLPKKDYTSSSPQIVTIEESKWYDSVKDVISKLF